MSKYEGWMERITFQGRVSAELYERWKARYLSVDGAQWRDPLLKHYPSPEYRARVAARLWDLTEGKWHAKR